MLIMAALLLMQSQTRGAAASAMQGKGGTIKPLPTPTPTPKKTITTKRNPPARTTSNSKTDQPAKTPKDSASAAEMMFWNSIKDSTNPDDFKAYLKKYPNGEFADLAANRLKTLEPAKSSTKSGATNPTSANLSPTNSGSANLPRSRTNQAGIEFVLIQPGSFMMGSNNGDADEKPVHQVTINYSFYMGKYEVTQAQWQSVMGNNPSYFKDCANCPVEQVSWNDAQVFIRKLNEMNDGYTYRLPTEAEWEYACRAGTTGDYAGILNEMGWYSENSGSKTHAVGSKRPNDWGLYDMHGNVDEWCEDWYHDSYYGAPTDGSAWLSGGEQKYQVLRGCAWNCSARGLRSAIRTFIPAGIRRNDDVGFRLAAVVRTR
ncbi:MAG TPA: formylglycine-generating enzyme family protein [Pyrinomonadaceae bacterium]|nr:formylglycine-generating enzyme family protein [Pyrinomonadaceae bacterium]